MTLQAFQTVACYLAQFPGRKNVMWVSGSFPIGAGAITQRRKTNAELDVCVPGLWILLTQGPFAVI